VVSTQEIKNQLYEIIENINDNDFLLTVKEIIDIKENSYLDPILSNWQLNRINESKEQINQRNIYSNAEADSMVEKWLLE
jgi:hypothetical protein